MGSDRHLVAVPGTSTLLTLAEVAERLRVSPRQLARILRAGDLPTVRQGRRRFVLVDDLAAYLAERRTP